MSQPRIAIVHDWLTNLAGAERTVMAMLKAFPDADLYTSVYDPSQPGLFDDRLVRTTWLQKIPGRIKYRHQLWAPFRPLAFKSLRLDDYDIVITSSSAESKNARTKKGFNLCYCHTPIRYFWVYPEKYIKDPGLGRLNFLAPILMPLLLGPLKRIDYRAAQKVDLFIANSKAVQSRIKEHYNKESEIIYPPVRVNSFEPASRRKNYYVTAGRQVAYKQHELAVRACSELGLDLLVLGNGPEHAKLKSIAGPTIKFNPDASDQDIAKAFSEAAGFIHPGEEDFGITPIEAMAGGCPVIAYQAGGALDYVVPGVSGEFFKEQSLKSLLGALSSFDPKTYQTKALTSHAKKFSEDRFIEELRTVVNQNRPL